MNDKIKVALADDHNLFRKGVEKLIGSFDNIQVLYSVSNGRELISLLSVAAEIPDVCILDVNMPELNGFETAKKIREMWPDIKILAVSFCDSQFNVLSMLRAGAGGYLLKNVQPDIFKMAIETIYETGFYYSEIVSGKIIRQIISGSREITTADLNENEVRFLRLCCSEMTYKEIAVIMGMSHRTIDGYRDHLFQKLDIKSRTGLVIYALRMGITSVG